ncbi:MAG: SGNH/GDSL hydrolase family protein [Pseudomonadota bacterium]
MNPTLIRRLFSATALVITALSSLPAQAGLYSGLVVFGDSLSDTGNLQILTGGARPELSQGPYFGGRYSDGPLWIETLATGFGLPSAATPYFAGGSNYAIAGARTGTVGNPPGVLAQVAGIWNGVADANALYVVVGGGNDMRDARSLFQTASAEDVAGREAAATAAVGNLTQTIGYLAAHGAKHVLVSNLPDLGNSPEAGMLGLRYASSDVTTRFNSLIPGLMTTGAGYGLDMSFLDMAGLLHNVIIDALSNGGATYGITNISSPCTGFTYSMGNACSASLFSDSLHPSAAAHQLIGRAALAAVVPEPESYALISFGLLTVAALGRRRTSTRAVAA